MNTKNNLVLSGLVFAFVGVLLGHYVWTATPPMGQHLMHNDSMQMDDMMTSMTAGLNGKTGDAFDKEFIDEMIVHHQGAVDMAKMVLATSKRPELLQLANDIVTAQTKEIGMMQEWRKSWFQ